MSEQNEPTKAEWLGVADAAALIRAATDDRQALNDWLGSMTFGEAAATLLGVLEVSSSIIRMGDQTEADSNGWYPSARQTLDLLSQSAQEARAMPPEME